MNRIKKLNVFVGDMPFFFLSTFSVSGKGHLHPLPQRQDLVLVRRRARFVACPATDNYNLFLSKDDVYPWTASRDACIGLVTDCLFYISDMDR